MGKPAVLQKLIN